MAGRSVGRTDDGTKQSSKLFSSSTGTFLPWPGQQTNYASCVLMISRELQPKEKKEKRTKNNTCITLRRPAIIMSKNAFYF